MGSGVLVVFVVLAARAGALDHDAAHRERTGDLERRVFLVERLGVPAPLPFLTPGGGGGGGRSPPPHSPVPFTAYQVLVSLPLAFLTGNTPASSPITFTSSESDGSTILALFSSAVSTASSLRSSWAVPMT